MSVLRRPVVFLATVAVLVVAVAVVTNTLPLRQIVDQRQEVAEARARLDELTVENAVLDDQVAALNTPLEIERLAREKLGYVRPGEDAYVVVEQPIEESPFDSVDAPATEGDAVPFVTRVLDFMTGRDLLDE